MKVTLLLVLLTIVLFCKAQSQDGKTVLSSVLRPERQGRSYYDRYEDRRCGRCDDDDDDDDRSRDDDRDRDDDRRSNKPTYGSRSDRNKYDDNYDDDKKKNGTEDDGDRNRSRKRNRNRHRYDDRDRYRLDYYDRFLREPYRGRYDRPYDPYSRGYDDRYDDFGRNDDFRRPLDDRYDRYDRYGGYGPGLGRGAHDRPWDETYRGQSGWDDGGRGYYFASGRPDATWARDNSRPISGGWQSGYRDPGYTAGYGSGYAPGYGSSAGYAGSADSAGYARSVGYAGSAGYGSVGYGAYGGSSAGYRSPGYGGSGYSYGGYSRAGDAWRDPYGQSGWRSVGYTSRPYRDQSGVAQLDNRIPESRYGPSSSTTPPTDYLFQREDDHVTNTETTS